MAEVIYATLDSMRAAGHEEDAVSFHGVVFETIANGLLTLGELGNAEAETDPPADFEADAFNVYLKALGTEGHDYYASPLEILAVAAAVNANVIITKQDNPRSSYNVVCFHLCCPGEVAILVQRGYKRGHFER